MAIPELTLSDRRVQEMQFADQPPRPLRARRSGSHDALAEAGERRESSRSAPRGHLRSPVVFDDINFSFRPVQPVRLAYGQAKTANVLFAVEATRRWADDGIPANAADAGRNRNHRCSGT